MAGTILLQDAQDEIERQLKEYASGLQQAGQGALTAISGARQQAGQTLQNVQNELTSYAQGLQVLPDVAGGAVQQLAQPLQQTQQNVQQVLTDYANQLVQAPPPVAPQVAEPMQAGATPSLPASEEPGTAVDVGGPAPGPGDDLASRWKTSFDWGQTYTGLYRTGTPHRGIDLVPTRGGIGTAVQAFHPGTVTGIHRDSGAGGLMVYVRDDQGLTHAYMHLAGTAPGLAVGQPVARGQHIAQMGESGTEGSPHLHYEVRKNAAVGDPLNQLIDPRPYMRGVSGGQQAAAAPTAAPSPAPSPIQAGVQRIGRGKDDFINSLAPLAKQFSEQTGIDAALMLAIAGHETGWGSSQNAKEKNNLFSIQGSSKQGGRWAGYDSPQESFQAFVDLISKAPRYAQAWADRHNPLQFIDDLRTAGYVADEPGFPAQTWVNATKRIYGEIRDQVGQTVTQVAGAAPPRAAVDQTPAGAPQPQPTVIQVGDQTVPTARQPIYGATMLAGAQEPGPLERGLTLAQDVAGGAQRAVGEAVGGIQQQAQQRIEDMQRQLDELRMQLEQYNQPPLAEGAPARRAIEAAAGGVAGAIAEPGRQIRAALEPEAGYSELPLGPSPGGGRVLGAGPPAFPAGSVAQQVESGQRDVRSLTPLEGAEYTAQVMGAGVGGVVDTYRALAQARRQAIEQNNPLREAFFVGGLSSAVADAVADPITWALPWARVANMAAGVATRSGLPLISGQVGGRIAGEALMNGLQNAALEMAQRDASPENVGFAFLAGAGFGGAVRGVQETPVAREIGRQIMQARGRGWPALQQFLRDESGELDVDAITAAARGAPPAPAPEAPVAPPRPPDLLVTEPPRLRGLPRTPSPPPAVPPAGVQRLPEYPAGSPEAGFEDLARASREAEPDGLARVDLNQLSNDIMPFEVNPSGPGVVKLNPGGMPQMDDLRALYRANEHKRSFYIDQGDEAANIVGSGNTGEFFTNNSITSMQTGVTRQVAEAIQAAGLVRQVARDSRAAGDAPDVTRQKILDALADPAQNVLAGPALNNKRAALINGYSTGEAPVSSGAKTSTFAGNYESAEGRFFDPRITNDIHNWRIMNVSSDQIPAERVNRKTGERQWFYDTPAEAAVANNDRAYRGVEAVFNELAREMGVDGYSVQSAMWDGIRAMQLRDPVAYRRWQQGFFRQAIEHAQRRGVFTTPTDAVADPGDIQRVMRSAPVQRELAKWQAVLKDPLPPELGIGDTVQRTFRGKALGRGKAAIPAKPSTRGFREQERVGAEAQAPVVQGLDRGTVEQLGYDPEREIFPWLEASHRVRQVAPDEYVVHLPAGNEDTARYVAAQVGQAADADAARIHVPDHRSTTVIGVSARGTADEVAALQRALDNMGIVNIRGTGGRSLQVPLVTAGDQATIDIVQDAALSVGFPESGLARYTGRTADVPRSEYGAATERLAPTFAPTTAGRRALLERGLGVLPEGGAPPVEPPGGLRRARGEFEPAFGAALGGAALGGYAGYAATPEGAEPEEYLRNIGLGATTGLLGARGISRLGPGAFARAGRAGGPPEARQPFRAPGGPELRATTQEPPGGAGGGATRPPRTLGEVHSNRYTLREAGPDETPLTDDELVTHYDMLERRMENVQARSEAIDEMLRNPNQKVQRPPWAAGYTNVQLAEIARRHGTSPYREYWWEPLGLEAGTGEVRYDVGESGVRSIQTDRELTPTELRREQRLLEQERQDLLAAADQLGSAGPGTRFAPKEAPTGPEGELPFDAGPVIAEGAVENAGPSGNLAEDIVTRNRTTKRPSGLKGLWQEPGQVVGQTEGVIGRGVADADTAATGEPSIRTKQLMPNLDAMLGDEMPEVRAQIQKAVEDNPELFEAYTQGRISHDSLFNDLAKRVGMTREDWLKTPVGKGFSTPELVALQAAAIDAQGGATDMAREILNRGGVDDLTNEEVAFGLSNLFDTTRLMAVARGARSTQGRGLNALKRGMDRRLARDISGSNESRAAKREAAAARRGAVRASRLLDKTRDLELEGKQAVAKAREAGLPRNIWEQIDEAYAQLDRYQALTLHEKADDFNRLAKERADRAAARKAKVREAPEELLSALRAELAAERKIFAGRKDTWETMAFWDSKAAEIAAEKRRGFRGGLYIEQQRKAARLAEKANEERARQAWDAQMRASDRQAQRATTILEHIGGEKPSRDLLRAFTEAVAADDDGLAAAKFLKGLSHPKTKWDTIVEAARSSNIMRLAGMLSSTATHLINSGGNVIQVPLELGTRQAVIGIDVLRSAATGGKRQAYQAEMLPMLKAWGPGFLSQWNNVKRQLTTGISPEELADLSTLRPGFSSKALPLVGRAIPERAAEVVDPAIEMPLRTLKASDIAFRGAAFAMQAQRVAVRQATREGFSGAQRTGRANNIVANLEDWPELYREAAEQAARMVYQERRTVPGLPRGPYREAEGLSDIAVSQIVPFRFTPANIFAQGFGLSPAGLVGVGEALGRRGRIAGKVATGELPPERLERQTLLAEERIARVAIGTGILAMGYMLGSQKDDQGKPKGMLTAMYDEDEASTYPQGWKAWSMRQENPANGEIVYVPLQNFGAAGVPLAMAALLTDAERRGRKIWEGDELMRAATGLGRYALDNTFLQGVSDFVDLLHDPARSGGKFVEGLVGSYGPYSAMGRQVQRAMGVASRNPREGFLGLLDAIEANYPGLSGNVPEATTALGEPRTPGATGFGALVGRYDIERDNPTLEALRAAGVDVPREPKVLPVGRGYGVELTEAERDTLKRARGAAITAAVARERAKPRVAAWERTMRTAAPDSAAYRDALARFNGSMRAVVSGAASSANADFQRQLGRDQVQARMKLTREIEPAYVGTPSAPVGELELEEAFR